MESPLAGKRARAHRRLRRVEQIRRSRSGQPGISLTSEHPTPGAVYCGMRVLCVGRHAFLSEHLCRYFQDVGAECEPAVGEAEALRTAALFEPHVVVSDCD